MKSTSNRRVISIALPVLILAAGVLLFSGCESDSVAPHDPTPALSKEDVASQAGYLGMMFKNVGVQIVNDHSAGAFDKDIFYSFSTGGVSGTIGLAYTRDGAPSDSGNADAARLYTVPGAPLLLTLGYGGSATFAFDLQAEMVPGSNEATIVSGSFGTFTSGDYSATFSFDDVVVVRGAAYPLSGSITFTSGDYVAVLTYNGGQYATLTVGGTTYTINLNNGDLT